MDFYLNAALLGSDDTSPFSFNVTGATPGAAALQVVAKDDNGGAVTSSVVNVTVSSGFAVTNTFWLVRVQVFCVNVDAYVISTGMWSRTYDSLNAIGAPGDVFP